MSFCPSCGTKNADDARFCESCGGSLQAPAPQQPAQPVVPQQPVMPQGAPAPQAAQYTAQAQQAAAQATGAVKSALGGTNRNLIIAGLVALVVVIALFVACKPMSKSDYRDAFEEHYEDYSDAMGDVYEAQSEISSKVYDDDLEKDDLKDANKDIDEGQAEAKKAAKKIMALNPPSSYRDSHKAVKTYFKLNIKAIDLIDKWQKLVKADMDEGDLEDAQEEFSDYAEDKIDEDDLEDAGEDFYEAVEDMRIDLYGSGDGDEGE